MELIAQVQGVDLGRLQPMSGWEAGAETDTDRGRVSVSLESPFHVRIRLHRVFALSEGWTNDLAAAVGVVGLWNRGGRLREVHARFPFMSCTELAEAFEDGDPAPTKWRQLLTSDWHREEHPLLEGAHAHPELRVCYPDISMGSLMLSRTPFDPDSGLAKITPLPEDRYRVTMLPTRFRREVTSLAEALAVAADCFRSLT
ncbi:DUF6193 family natural product biosynthesis protein [Streptomyces melanogenes]|uniref:DUF6193 family natural product biosynthesis protein n=1 Tax=Streptomyces melanogenes TaxID=67326 RepID=UPI003789563F